MTGERLSGGNVAIALVHCVNVFANPAVTLARSVDTLAGFRTVLTRAALRLADRHAVSKVCLLTTTAERYSEYSALRQWNVPMSR